MHDDDLWHAYTKTITRRVAQHIIVPPPVIHPLHRRSYTHTLDLHGLALTDAYTRTFEFLAATRYRYKYVTIITGSSAIRAEFMHWIADNPDIRRCQSLSGDGSFRIHFVNQSSCNL